MAIQGPWSRRPADPGVPRDEPTTPFHYVDKGTMATIGRHAAVADLPAGIRLSGVIGWLAWLVLHLVMLIGVRNRLNVLVNWAWSYVTYDRASRIITNVDDVDPDDTSIVAAGDTDRASRRWTVRSLRGASLFFL